RWRFGTKMSSPIKAVPVPPWPNTSASTSTREPKSTLQRPGDNLSRVQGLPPPGTRRLIRRIARHALPERPRPIERDSGETALRSLFHRAVTAFELVVRIAQRLFRRETVGAHEIDSGEKKIARFFQLLIGRSFHQFADLLEQLGSRPAGIGPVET